jgi:dTDP-4-amino-4,6-dideoxygalactose transaminase
MPDLIPFNKPFTIGNEMVYMQEAVQRGRISGDGYFTKQAQLFMQNRYGFKKALLTTSCTDALEMAALLAELKPGDEIILPSFTFVSTANAFVLKGAMPVFCDVDPLTLNLDVKQLESLITPKTKVIVPVHYAGISCDMDPLLEIAKHHHILVVEDAAQALDAKYKGRPLGSLGNLAAFSFHETKNVICGEGGALTVNDEQFLERAEIIREKGTNRAAFFRGEAAKYDWLDVGSSFLPSDLNAAYLFAQFEKIETIQQKRLQLWETYFAGLKPLAEQEKLQLPHIPDYATHNGAHFFLLCRTPEDRTKLLEFLRNRNIMAVFHYLPLHQSPFYLKHYAPVQLPVTESAALRLVRLPFFFDLQETQQQYIIESLRKFFA